jgi:hypothetical protein
VLMVLGTGSNAVAGSSTGPGTSNVAGSSLAGPSNTAEDPILIDIDEDTFPPSLPASPRSSTPHINFRDRSLPPTITPEVPDIMQPEAMTITPGVVLGDNKMVLKESEEMPEGRITTVGESLPGKFLPDTITALV